MRIRWGRNAGAVGVVASAMFKRAVDYPDDHAAGYHVVLGDKRVVTVRLDQVAQ